MNFEEEEGAIDPQEEVMASLVSRRSVLGHLSKGALAALAGAALVGGSSQSAQALGSQGGSTARDIAILNFALNFEYLEGELYSYATTGQGLAANGIETGGQNGTGTTTTAGATTGGARVTFDTPQVDQAVRYITYDEQHHIAFLRSTITNLGGTPIAKPTINLQALQAAGADSTTLAGVLVIGRVTCDVGVSAYAGAAQYLFTPAVILNSSRILAAEGYHAGALRLLHAQRSITAPKVDPKDIPPPNAPGTASSGRQYIFADRSTARLSQAPIRTVTELLAVAYGHNDGVTTTPGGFFPNGINADLATLSALPASVAS